MLSDLVILTIITFAYCFYYKNDCVARLQLYILYGVINFTFVGTLDCKNICCLPFSTNKDKFCLRYTNIFTALYPATNPLAE